MYIFGGAGSDSVLNDLWAISLKEGKISVNFPHEKAMDTLSGEGFVEKNKEMNLYRLQGSQSSQRYF